MWVSGRGQCDDFICDDSSVIIRVQFCPHLRRAVRTGFQYSEGVTVYQQASIEIEVVLLDLPRGFVFRALGGGGRDV
jgi:hypothetical protein